MHERSSDCPEGDIRMKPWFFCLLFHSILHIHIRWLKRFSFQEKHTHISTMRQRCQFYSSQLFRERNTLIVPLILEWDYISNKDVFSLSLSFFVLLKWFYWWFNLGDGREIPEDFLCMNFYQGKSVIKKAEHILQSLFFHLRIRKFTFLKSRTREKRKRIQIGYIIIQSLLIDTLSFNYSLKKKKRSRVRLKIFFSSI